MSVYISVFLVADVAFASKCCVELMKVRIIAPDSSSLSPEVGTCFTKGSRLDSSSLSVQNYISLAAKLNCNETFDTSAPMRRKLYNSSEESENCTNPFIKDEFQQNSVTSELKFGNLQVK